MDIQHLAIVGEVGCFWCSQWEVFQHTLSVLELMLMVVLLVNWVDVDTKVLLLCGVCIAKMSSYVEVAKCSC